jgi:hypothetical protein
VILLVDAAPLVTLAVQPLQGGCFRLLPDR